MSLPTPRRACFRPYFARYTHVVARLGGAPVVTEAQLDDSLRNLEYSCLCVVNKSSMNQSGTAGMTTNWRLMIVLANKNFVSCSQRLLMQNNESLTIRFLL